MHWMLSWMRPRYCRWSHAHLSEQITETADWCRWPPIHGDHESFNPRRWRRIALHHLSIDPGHADAWTILGYSEFRLAYAHRTRNPHDHYKAAVEAYRKVAELKGDARSWVDLGDICMYAGDGEGQLATFIRASEIYPKTGWIWFRLGETYSNLGDNEQAVASFRRAIDLTDDTVALGWCYREIGSSELRMGHGSQAIDAFIQSCAFDNCKAFERDCTKIARDFFDHLDVAVALYNRLEQLNQKIAEQFDFCIRPLTGTVTYAKEYYRLKTCTGPAYFVRKHDVSAAGIAMLRVGDRVEFRIDVGPKVLVNHLKVIERA